jgi:hypothetical protein
MTTPPKPDSYWVESKTRIVCTVESIVNTKDKAPLPPMVVYREDSGDVCAEFVDNFLDKREPFDRDKGHAPAVEIVMPDYQVYFGNVPDRVPPGLSYFIDAEYECSIEEATLEVRRVIGETYKRYNGFPPAGVKQQPIFDKDSQLKFVRRPATVRQELQERCSKVGINYVGIVQGRPLIWGNRLSNGAPIYTHILLASCLRHAFRSTAFVYNDQIAGNAWERNFGDAWQFFKASGWLRKGEDYRIGIVGEVLHLRLAQDWFIQDNISSIEICVKGEQRGSAKIPLQIMRELRAMYDMTKIIGGIA